MQALTGGACGPAIDMWSLGCVLAEVALQRPLFPATSAAELMQQVQHQALMESYAVPHSCVVICAAFSFLQTELLS